LTNDDCTVEETQDQHDHGTGHQPQHEDHPPRVARNRQCRSERPQGELQRDRRAIRRQLNPALRAHRPSAVPTLHEVLPVRLHRLRTSALGVP
jgi:hypothetical protein